MDFALKLIEMILIKGFFGIVKLLFYTLPKLVFRLIFHGSKKAIKTAKSCGFREAQDGAVPPDEISSHEPKGFIFGRNLGYYLVKPETQDGHILIVGGSGSGKTSCLAIPSLLSWQGRVFAIDIKGELHQKTNSKRPNAKVFNPLDSDTYGYNPFYLLDKSRNPAQDAQEMALAMIPLPPNTREPYWIENAQNLLTGAILHYWGAGLSFPETILEIQKKGSKELVELIYNSPTESAALYVAKIKDLDTDTLGGFTTEMSNN